MIVADSSVWISHLRGRASRAVDELRRAIDLNGVVVGDLILLELLQGARDDRVAARLEDDLRTFPVERMLDESIAIEAAGHVRHLRRRGITVRKTIDVIIATFCLQRGYALLHEDRDFTLMAPLIGLRIA